MKQWFLDTKQKQKNKWVPIEGGLQLLSLLPLECFQTVMAGEVTQIKPRGLPEFSTEMRICGD